MLAFDRRVCGCDWAFDLKFCLGVCERLGQCTTLGESAGLAQFQAREVATETALFLKSRLCSFEGELGHKIKQSVRNEIVNGFGASLFLNIMLFLSSKIQGFRLDESLSEAQQWMSSVFMLIPGSLGFLCM
jgi:hypothetical protein